MQVYIYFVQYTRKKFASACTSPFRCRVVSPYLRSQKSEPPFSFHPSASLPLPSFLRPNPNPQIPRLPPMAAADADAAEVERLYELGERLSSSKDKSEVPPPILFS